MAIRDFMLGPTYPTTSEDLRSSGFTSEQHDQLHQSRTAAANELSEIQSYLLRVSHLYDSEQTLRCEP